MIPMQREPGQYIWWHHTPRMAYSPEDAFIIGYRVGRARRHVYSRVQHTRERRAIARMLSAYKR